MPPRSEPLLWVQLIGAGVLPLEALLLLLMLAGSDPGPFPGLERLLCWALGGLGPTLLLWHRPADVWSLLVLQTPLRARRPLQQRLSRLQESQALRLGLLFAGAVSLPLLWWLDDHAAVASSLSPLAGSPRLVVLLLAAVVLALMLWQWQQLLQSLWLLSRTPEVVGAAKPLTQAELEDRRLCLGLPLLLLDPLILARPPVATGTTTAAAPGPGSVFTPKRASAPPPSATPPVEAAEAFPFGASVDQAAAEPDVDAASGAKAVADTLPEPVESGSEPTPDPSS